MAYENVPESKRALYSAIPQIGLPIGFGLSSILIAIPTLIFPEEIGGSGSRSEKRKSRIYTDDKRILENFAAGMRHQMGGWCAQKMGSSKTFIIGGLASAALSIPTLKVIEWSHGNLWITIIGIVLGWSIAYNLIWAVISSLWSSYFETEVRYSGISFVYHVPSFLVAGMVPTICTLLINYGNGNTIYVGLYSAIVALISVGCCILLKYRHEQGKR